MGEATINEALNDNPERPKKGEGSMKNFRVFVLAGVSSFSFVSAALAQDVRPNSPEETAVNDAEIVVSARRREEVLQDVPLVVNAVTADTIGKLNLRKFEDIQSVVPGLQMKNN